MKIRTRFAPSPTGYPHVANIRTAIYNWLFARSMGGDFLIRIEDTDKERSKQEYEDDILNTLKWMDIDYDKTNDKEIFIRQSNRIPEYQKIAQQLKEQDNAYYCQCIERPQDIKYRCNCYEKKFISGVLRFKVKENNIISFDDMIYGKCSTNSNEIEDFAILRSNGDPTYMLAVVVDDVYSNITHVIRGEDHRTNTFKQIMIYNEMGWNMPIFGHLPMILGTDHKKLSKRNGDSSVKDLKEVGYVKEAIFNALLRVGWGYENEEIITRNRALEIFSIKDISKGSAIFDIKKLQALSAHYIRFCNYSKDILDKLDEKYQIKGDINIINKIYNDIATRSNTIADAVELIKFLFIKPSYNIYEFNQEIINEIKSIKLDTNFDDFLSTIKSSKNSKELMKAIRIIKTGSQSGLPMNIIYEYTIHNKNIL